MTATRTTTIEKFEKGAFYEDGQGNLFVCTNGRQRKTADGNDVVDMKATKNGKPVGKAGEEYVDTFVRKLSKADVQERLEVERREAEAEADANQPEPKAAKKKDKPAKKTPAKKADGKLSALDAAAKVLAEAGAALSTKTMIEQMATKGYWTSPGGATPHATLYAALMREINVKGNESRFKKTGPGHFASNA